ncbi:MAG: hypothetical protein HKN35_06930 [Woeseia sp.]|nr:hypothetical protein [Woeseia sp.]NNE60608.1 hypothetical protein [Woeseia sp.]
MAQDDTLRPENRETNDRRTFQWRTVFYGFARSRRRDGRRDTEIDPMFSDWHHPWLFFLAVSIMLLSCLDAFMTLLLLERGAYEANPVMAAIMGESTRAFAAIKMLLTALGILALVFLSRSRFLDAFRTGLILTCVFAFYACLICYEFVYLLSVH